MSDDDALRWEQAHYPVSTRFDDGYFSRDGGRAESHAVFLAGNRLPERLTEHLTQHRKTGSGAFTIAELGFGTGLNFYETVLLWRTLPAENATLHYVSFEQFPLRPADCERALQPWPELLAIHAEFFAGALPGALPGAGWQRFQSGNITLDLALGDANTMLPDWAGRAQAWYLDGFAPAKNPQLWRSRLLQRVADKTAAAGTFSTYTAAAQVRRDLTTAGFDVQRVPGFGRKRHRLQGVKK